MTDSFPQFATFANHLDQCYEVDEVWQAFERFGRDRGVPRVACAHAEVGRVGHLEQPQVRTSCGPAAHSDWAAGRLYMRDPIVKRARGSSASFVWGLDYLRKETADQKLRTFYRGLADTVRSMLIVPLPRAGHGALNVGILGNSMPGPEFERFIAGQRSLLMLATIYADRRMTELHERSRRSEIALLPREAECLEWIASGETVEGTGQRMGMPRPTVEACLAVARRKLGAATIEQAIAIGLKHRVIRP